MMAVVGTLVAATGATGDGNLEDAFGDGLELRQWVTAAIILASAIVIGRVLQAIVQRVMSSDDTDAEITHFAAAGFRNLVILAGIVYALSGLEVRLGPLLGAIGLGGLAVAFAAQSILANFFASIVLRTRRPFKRGDQVALGAEEGAIEGTVEVVNFRTVSLRTFDGERALVPCDEVLSNTIINLTTRGRRRTTLDVAVAYETDLAQAVDVLEGATREVEGVLAEPPVHAFVMEMSDSGVSLALQFWHRPTMMEMWRVRSRVGIAAHVALGRAGIEIPFPQQVVRFRPAPAQDED